MQRALVFHLKPEVFISTSKPSFLTSITNQEFSSCQAKPEDEMAGVGADQDQVTTPVESSATVPVLPAVRSLGDQQPACDLCQKCQAPPSDTPAPVQACGTTQGCPGRRAKGSRCGTRRTSSPVSSTQDSFESKPRADQLCRFSHL